MGEFEVIKRRSVGSGASKKELTTTVLVRAENHKSAYTIAKKNTTKHWTVDKKDVHLVVTEERENVND